jgi:hypothetical protein
LLAVLVPVASEAQQVMAPPRQEPPLDSTAQYYRGMLERLRDALDAVSASANELRRDLPTAGDVTVLAKAERLSRTCAAARPPLREALPALARARGGVRLAPARDSLGKAIRALEAGLDEQCVRGLGPAGPGAGAETVREWARYRTAEMQHLIVVYQSAAARFAAAMGFKLPIVAP